MNCGQTVRWGPVGITFASLLGEEHETRNHGWNKRWHHLEFRPTKEELTQRDLMYCDPSRLTNPTTGGYKSTMAKPRSFCIEDVQAGYSETCNRPVKDRGKCGIHLRSELQEEKRIAENREHREIQRHIREEVEKLCARLESEFGIKAKVHYERPTQGWEGHYTGKVIVNPIELLDALEEERF